VNLIKLFDNHVLGIEFRDDCISVVCLKKGMTGFKLTASINIPFNGSGVNDDTVSELKKFLTQNGINAKKVSISIPRDWSLIKFMDVPSPDRNALRNVLRYEIERHIPFDIDDIYYDFQIAAEKSNVYRVIVVGIQKEKLEYVKNFLDKVPLNPWNVSVASFCNLNALELSEYKTNIFKDFSGIGRRPDIFGSKESVCASVIIKPNGYEIAVIKNGLCIFLKKVPIDLTIPHDSILTVLSDDITDTVDKITGKKPDRIVLSGDAVSGLKGLMVGTGTRIKVVEKLSCLSKNGKSLSMNDILSATGACYSAFGLGSTKINLLPVKRGLNKKAGPVIAKISLGVIALLSCMPAVLEINREKYLLKAVEKEISKNKPEVMEIEKISSEFSMIDKKIKHLKDIETGNMSRLDMLAELSVILPENVWLSGFSCTKKKKWIAGYKGEMIISGFTKSYSDLISLIENSPYFENAEFVKPITKSGFGEAFEIKASIAAPNEINVGQEK
jgi:hypothetical protein